MGVASDGVYAASQQNSWPAQLARLAHRELSLPLIQAPGAARRPFAAAARQRRADQREGAGLAFSLRQCMPNEDGVVLPTATSRSMVAHRTRAPATPENPDPGPRIPVSARVALRAVAGDGDGAQNPKVVSWSSCGNDILGASQRILSAGHQRGCRCRRWEPQYRQVVARVDAAANMPCSSAS
jgi:hypothetical protein